ncbi:MAG: hypothetical protein JWS12_242 [Candidatus Saccharibacteria bacterium]|nr:hypothetical protein [Candidatus Saccharibacteria bacterium]
MRFIKVTDSEPVAKAIAQKLLAALADDQHVLWLVPGGSAIAVAARVSQLLSGVNLQCLSMTLTDERYGPVGHADSNWQQLKAAGFALPGAHLVPVLIGKDLPSTTEAFAQQLAALLHNASYSLGLFGIGPDGHTAGILPGSLAVTSSALAASYDAGNFQRISMTPLAIAKLDAAVVYATGEAKQPVLDALEQSLSLDKQPAQSLKTISELNIYNDYKGVRK